VRQHKNVTINPSFITRKFDCFDLNNNRFGSIEQDLLTGKYCLRTIGPIVLGPDALADIKDAVDELNDILSSSKDHTADERI
jgi:hypothetical protein